MKSSFSSRIWIALVGLVISVLLVQVLVSSAQEPVKIPPRSNYQYRKDHAQVTELMKISNAGERATKLEAFIKVHPESRMIPFIAAQVIAPLVQAGNWQKVIAECDRFGKMIPADKKGISEAEIEAINNLRTYRMNGYFKTDKLAKAAEIAEQIYKEKPTKEMATELAGIYLKLNNTPKYVEYGEKIVASYPINQSYGTVLQLADIYLKQQNVDKALQYIGKVVAAFGATAPQGTTPRSWDRTLVFYYGALAAKDYAKKDFAGTISNYELVLGVDSKNDDAYYYIAMAKWNGGDQAGAIPYFARASVLNQKRAMKAREYLEQLYRAENSDSLDGLDDVLAKAKADLGVS